MNDKKYSKEHEWVSVDNNIATIGITNHAQESLGDIVFIELPKINSFVKSGDQIGIVESVKAASDLYSPVSGEIIETNNELIDSPQKINSDPESGGWIAKIKIDDLNQLDLLLNLDQYMDMIK